MQRQHLTAMLGDEHQVGVEKINNVTPRADIHWDRPSIAAARESHIDSYIDATQDQAILRR
jgi:hypothetical protein